MKAGIFYISSKQTSSRLDRQYVHTSTGPMWIRVEEVEAADLSDALDKAKPDEDEAVMNTHWLP